MTTTQNTKPIVMYYDDACVMCRSEAKNMQARNPTGIQLTPVDEGIEELTAAGYNREDAMTYLCVKDSHGHWHTSMDAVRLLYKTANAPMSTFFHLPVIKQLGDFVYPFVARNRYRVPDRLIKWIYGDAVVAACKDGICKLPPAKR